MAGNDFIRGKALDIVRKLLVNNRINKPGMDDDPAEMEDRMNGEVDNIIQNLLEHIDRMDPRQKNRQTRKLSRKNDGALPEERLDGYDRFREILAGRLGSMVADVPEGCFETRSEQERFLAWAETLAENELADFIKEGAWKTWIRAEVNDQWGFHMERDEENQGTNLDVLWSMSEHEENELVERFEWALKSLDFGETFTEIINELTGERWNRKRTIEKKAGKPVTMVEALSLQLKEAGIENRIWPNPSRPDMVRVYLTLPEKWLEPGEGHPRPRVNAYLEFGASPSGKAANDPYDGSPHTGNDPLPRITTDSDSPTLNLELLGKLGDFLVKEGIISPERVGYYSVLTRDRPYQKGISPSTGMKPE